MALIFARDGEVYVSVRPTGMLTPMEAIRLASKISAAVGEAATQQGQMARSTPSEPEWDAGWPPQ